jgi:hypothetical protein
MGGKMYIFEKYIYDINEEDVNNLIQFGAPEMKKIEYKKILPGEKDSDKKGFLADVSSFANGSGGLLFYGIEAKDGIPINKVGIHDGNQDSVKLRLDQLIQSGIQPRIPGVIIHSLLLSNQTYIFIIKIPQSWCGPHMVVFQWSSRFYSRNSAGKYQLDVNEIRQAFLGAEGVFRQAKLFRDDRLGKIVSDETQVELDFETKIVLHILPIYPYLYRSTFFDIPRLANEFTKIKTICDYQNGFRINLAGIVSYFGQRDASKTSYTQIFRDGPIESVDCEILNNPNDEKNFPISYFENRIINSVEAHLELLKQFQFEPPYVVFLSLLNVLGYKFVFGQEREWQLKWSRVREIDKFDCKNIFCPEIIIEEEGTNISKAFQPAFDVIWNAGGFKNSMNYDQAGNWKPE